MSFLTTFSDEASKTYKDAARTATTGPINLLSAPASIGSVSLNLNDRVLVKDQANAEENGIYVFKGAGSPMVRSTDANSDREVLPNMLISVSEGDYEDKIFELTTNGPISLGVTPLSFGLAILPIDLTTDVVGVLPVANGGTNKSSWTEGRVVFAGASGSALTEDSNLNWDNSNKQLTVQGSQANSVADGTIPSNNQVTIRNTAGDATLYLVNDDQVNAGLGNLINSGSAIELSGKWNSSFPTSHRTFGRIGAFKENNIDADTAGYLALYTQQTGSPVKIPERMRITSSGNVLIGTTDASLYTTGALLKVASSSVSNNARIEIRGSTTTDQAALDLGAGAQRNGVIAGQDRNLLFFTNSAAGLGNVTERMRITSAGNVGIRQTNPESPLHVAETTKGVITVSKVGNAAANEDYAEIRFRAIQDNYAVPGYASIVAFTQSASDQNGLKFITRNASTPAERMRITREGNVGIGTASPAEKLEVAGNAKAEGLLLQSRHNLTGAVTVLSNDYYVGCNSSGGAVTVALQSAATAKQGRKLVIKAESSLANVTINAAAGETIDGSASHVLNVSYESVTLVCNGANAWFIV